MKDWQYVSKLLGVLIRNELANCSNTTAFRLQGLKLYYEELEELDKEAFNQDKVFNTISDIVAEGLLYEDEIEGNKGKEDRFKCFYTQCKFNIDGGNCSNVDKCFDNSGMCKLRQEMNKVWEGV